MILVPYDPVIDIPYLQIEAEDDVAIAVGLQALLFCVKFAFQYWRVRVDITLFPSVLTTEFDYLSGIQK